jgi:hypothetical protein
VVHIPGFPNEVSAPIELPDIGELLMYRPFGTILAEDYLQHANSFQKYLFELIPLKNNRKFISLRSAVWLLQPGSRSHVTRLANWHVDGGPNAHREPDQVIHILQSKCLALTEFNSQPFNITSPHNETRVAFSGRICRDPAAFGVVGRPVEPGRIYTFTNHLHRAVEPARIEFRFVLRVCESDTLPFEHQRSAAMKAVSLRVVDNSEQQRHIEYLQDRVSIFYTDYVRKKAFGLFTE